MLPLCPRTKWKRSSHVAKVRPSHPFLLTRWCSCTPSTSTLFFAPTSVKLTRRQLGLIEFKRAPRATMHTSTEDSEKLRLGGSRCALSDPAAQPTLARCESGTCASPPSQSGLPVPQSACRHPRPLSRPRPLMPSHHYCAVSLIR